MRVLAIDTATPVASAALADGQKVVAEESVGGQRNHSEQLLQMVDRLFAETGWEGRGLDLVAVSIGPGSFTGLRVGISAAQGLAFAYDRPLAGVPTLEIVAVQSAPRDGYVSPMLDARKGQVYACLFRRISGDLEQVQGETVLDPAAWVESLPAPALLIGNGTAVYYDVIAPCAASRGCVIAPVDLGVPRASTLAVLAQQKYAGMAGRPESVSARYIRPPDALISKAQK